MLGTLGTATDNGPLMIRVCVAMMCVSGLGVALRLIARRVAKQRLWLDDWLILLSLTISWIMTVLHLASVITSGYGKHITVVLETPAELVAFFKYLYTIQIIYPVSIAIIKISILAFYRRIFSVSGTKIPIYTIGAIVVAWLLAVDLVGVFSCKPVHGFWDRDILPKCINTIKYYWGVAIPNIATDATLLLFPLPIIWHLHLPINQRLSLMLIFAVGGFIIVISSLRLVTIIEAQASEDVTYVLIPLGIFNVIEANVTIFLACLPSITPLFRLVFLKPPVRTSSPASKNTPNTASSSTMYSWFIRNKKKRNESSSFTRLHEVSAGALEAKLGQESTVRTDVLADSIELADVDIEVQKPREARVMRVEGIQVRSDTKWEYEDR